MKVLSQRDYTGLTGDENLALDADRKVSSTPLQMVPSKLTAVYSETDSFKDFYGLGKSTTWDRIDLPTSDGLFEVVPPETGWYIVLVLLVFNVEDASSGSTMKIRATNGVESSAPVFRWVRHRYGFGLNPESTQKNSISLALPLYVSSTNPIYLEMAAGLFRSNDDPHVFYGDSDPNQMIQGAVRVYHQSNIVLLRSDNTTSTNLGNSGKVKIFPST
tara:strand:- start:6328 stop:6978 length:651 start_codon:yes stop_codon:yes gene_type:complete